MRKLRLVSLVYFIAVFGTSCVMLCSKADVAPNVLIGKHKLAIQKTKWKKASLVHGMAIHMEMETMVRANIVIFLN